MTSVFAVSIIYILVILFLAIVIALFIIALTKYFRAKTESIYYEMEKDRRKTGV